MTDQPTLREKCIEAGVDAFWANAADLLRPVTASTGIDRAIIHSFDAILGVLRENADEWWGEAVVRQVRDMDLTRMEALLAVLEGSDE